MITAGLAYALLRSSKVNFSTSSLAQDTYTSLHQVYRFPGVLCLGGPQFQPVAAVLVSLGMKIYLFKTN